MREELGLCQKRTDYEISVQKVAPGTDIYNYLEDCHYTTDETRCYVLTGTVGEQWPVNQAKLEKTYKVSEEDRYLLEKGIMLNVQPKESADKIYAERAEQDTQVHTSWGDVLTAHEGDVIAFAVKDGEVDKNDSWVINKDVFNTTYEKVDGTKFEEETQEIEIER